MRDITFNVISISLKKFRGFAAGFFMIIIIRNFSEWDDGDDAVIGEGTAACRLFGLGSGGPDDMRKRRYAGL